MDQLLFNSSYGLKLTVGQIVGEIVGFMKLDSKRQYKITIGTDSEQVGGAAADFVTAVVVHRVGNGGRYFWRRLELGKFHTLRDRIIKEVIMSLEVAQEVLTELKKLPEIKFDFEIHADIGENGETKVMIQEVVGMIRAYNFEPKTKPSSYAASNVADRHV
ncbi:MAG: ribonuclease H-like YkuK family protein [Candidatus Liptonbacteria bacterium]|nr:ribonuclease H-like YkuK family protein [Candidatus Liptonbacteria bacterium]